MNFYQQLIDFFQMEKVKDIIGNSFTAISLSSSKHFGLALVFGIVKRSCGYNRIISELDQG